MTLTAQGAATTTGRATDRGKAVSMPSHPSHSIQMAQDSIAVGKDWRLRADDLNVITYRRVRVKSGTERWEVQGYYGTIGQALVGLVRQGVRDTGLTNIKALADRITELETEILTACRSLEGQ